MDNNRPSLESLFDDFEHPNPNINKEAFLSMYKYWPYESMGLLILKLDSKDVETRRKSVKALSCFETFVIMPMVELYLASNVLIIRVSCLKVLVRVAANHDLDVFYEEIKPVIELALNDEAVEIILALVPLLRHLGPKANSVLLKLSRDSNILRAKAAITALGEIMDSRSNHFLRELSHDQSIDELLRESARESLNNCF